MSQHPLPVSRRGFLATATARHLGNLAIRLGRKIQWDPQSEQIVGDEVAAAMQSRTPRAPWQLA